MNENFTKTELLIQYLDGELDGDQLEAIKKSIDEDGPLRAELEKLYLAKEVMKSYGLKNKIGLLHSDMMQELKMNVAPGIGVTRRILRYSVRIAAVVVLLVGLSTLYQYYTVSPEKLFKENFQVFTLRETRGIPGSLLEDSYKKENMREVIQMFNRLKDPKPEDYFLAGNAFLSSHQPAKAIQAFVALQEKNRTNNTHYFEEDTEYYLALS